MMDISLRVTCDRAAAPNFGVLLGAGWARVTTCLSPPPDWEVALLPFFKMAKPMLEFLGVVPPPRVRVVIDGPDAPADTSEARGAAASAWASLLGSPVSGPAPASLAAAALSSPAPAPLGIDERVVKSMVDTVRKYAERHGSAPDFGADTPGVHKKVYNYIRSTTANQQAPDGLIEEVRRRLAGEPRS
jgi:hypothetical protein